MYELIQLTDNTSYWWKCLFTAADEVQDLCTRNRMCIYIIPDFRIFISVWRLSV